MGSIVYDACLPEKRPDEEIINEARARMAAASRNAMPKYTDFVSDTADESTQKIGTTLRINFPPDYVVADGPRLRLDEAIRATADHQVVFGRPSKPEQPAFMVYHPATNEMIPLTQSRLDELVVIEKHYGHMIKLLREITEYRPGWDRPFDE